MSHKILEGKGIFGALDNQSIAWKTAPLSSKQAVNLC